MRTLTIAAALALALLASARPLAAQGDTAVTKLTADFGYVQTSGNTQVTTMSVGEKLSRAKGRLTLSQTFNFVYGEQRDTVNTNNLRATVRGDYRIDGVFFLFAGAGFDRNVFAGIEKRFEELVGLQWMALASSSDTLRFEGGGSMTQQIPVAGLQQNFPSARAAGSWKHAFTPMAYFQQNVEYIPNLEEHQDWRFNTESAIVAPLSARIGVKLSYVIRYDNLPEPGFSETDKLFTTGIQLTFD